MFLLHLSAIITDVKTGFDGRAQSVIAQMSDGQIRNSDVTKIALIDSMGYDDL